MPPFADLAVHGDLKSLTRGLRWVAANLLTWKKPEMIKVGKLDSAAVIASYK